jgi:tetratricopeptide (TPR) repeat protein
MKLHTGVFAGMILIVICPLAMAADSWETQFERGILVHRAGRYAEAEGLFRVALDTIERTQPKQPRIAEVLNNLAAENHLLARFVEAERYYKLALEHSRRQPEAGNVSGRTLINLAGLYRLQGRYSEAESTCLEGIRELERSTGPESGPVATAFATLAEIYRVQEKLSKAESLAERALAIAQRGDTDDPRFAAIVHTLAGIYLSAGKAEKAGPLFERSRDIMAQSLGPQHPNVAADLNGLAEIACQQQHYAEAEALFRQTLAIWERAFGAEHPSTAIALNNVAQTVRFQKRYREAETLYQRSAALLETNGTGLDRAKCLGNLADLYHEQGREPRAVEYYQYALTAAKQELGENHPEVALLMKRLAEVRRSQRNYAESVKLYKQSIAILQRSFGPDDPALQQSLTAYKQLVSESSRFIVAAPSK